MNTIFSPDAVTVQEVPATPVAVMEHRGNPAAIGATIQRFIAWRRANGLPPRVSATYNASTPDRAPSRRRRSGWSCARGPIGRWRRMRKGWRRG